MRNVRRRQGHYSLHWGNNGLGDKGTALAIQQDGKLLLAGFSETLPFGSLVLVRFNANFPNPALDLVYLKFEKSGNKEVTVYDITGKAIVRLNTAKDLTEIELNKLSAGMYFIHIGFADGTTQTKKWMKH